MSEQRALLAETVERLFTDIGVGRASPDDWGTVSELGIVDLFLAEEDGGFGGNWQDAFVVFRASGLCAVALPIAETLVARKLLREAGITPPEGGVAIANAVGAQVERNAGGTRRVTASINSLAWHSAPHVLLAANDGNAECLVLLDTQTASDQFSRNGADGEPRGDLRFASAAPLASASRPNACADLQGYGALMRAAQMAGALQAALDLSITYVNERVQFGRTLSKFQVLQHQIALLAEEVAAVTSAAQSACLALDAGDGQFAIAASKLRANRSVQQSTSIAHQVHGAIGFTREHALHYFTQRLWNWRSDFGNDRFWAEHLGRMILRGGAADLWPLITRSGTATR